MGLVDDAYPSKYGLLDRGVQFVASIAAISTDAVASRVQAALAPARRANGSFDVAYLTQHYRKDRDGPLTYFQVPYIGTSKLVLGVWAETGGVKLRGSVIRKNVDRLVDEEGPDAAVDWLLSQPGGDRLGFKYLLSSWQTANGNAQFLDEYYIAVVATAIDKWRP